LDKVLVTGGAGYVGSTLVRILLRNNYSVRVIDRLDFSGDSLIGIYNHPNFEFIKGDLREEEIIDGVLENIDHIVHLAAIVGDPACAEQPEEARSINWKASKMLYDKAINQGSIDRFIFGSTCSNYGKMNGEKFMDENSELRPVSLYAELKVKFEKYLLNSNTGNNLTPTSLRFATAYGLSPRPRFDLTVNDFTRHLYSGKELVIYGRQFWRPYCHVYDIGRAILKVLESSAKNVDHEVFGVGDTEENYQKDMIVEELLNFFPEADIKYVQKEDDPRDYRVDFSKIKDQLNFEINKTVPDGIQEIKSILEKNILSNPYDPNYENI